MLRQMYLKNLVKQTITTIYRNRYGFVLSASVLHFAMSVVGVNILFWLFRLILLVANQTNLNKDNIYTLFSNPFNLFLILVYILIVAFFTFIEFSILIEIVQSRKNNSKFSLRKITKNTFNKVKNLLGVQIVFFILYFIMMVPLENLGLSSVLTERLRIPTFIAEEVSKTSIGAFMYITLMMIILYCNIRLIFTLPLAILKNKKLSTSIRESWNITKKRKMDIVLAVALLELILLVVLSIVLVFSAAALDIFANLSNRLIAQTIFKTILDALVFIFVVMSKIILVNVILSILDDEKIVGYEESDKIKSKHSRLLALIFSSLLTWSIVGNALNIYYTKIDNKLLKIAHRGDVHGGVENSIEALESAKKKGADYAETDTQMTKDGEFIIIHDSNLKRLTGEDKNIRDLTLSEIKELKIKSGYFESHIPTLEEYINKAKEIKIKAFIEIKTNGGEPKGFERIFVDKFRRLNAQKDFKVMSLETKVVDNIEKIAPEIQTGYVIPIMFGEFGNSNIDFYAIEDFSFRESYARYAHKKNRQIFVWTLNSKSELYRYLSEPIDGIITDEIEELKKLEEQSREKESILESFVRIILLKF